MSKKKTEKMKENRAGSYVPREFAEEIVATIESYVSATVIIAD